MPEKDVDNVDAKIRSLPDFAPLVLSAHGARPTTRLWRPRHTRTTLLRCGQFYFLTELSQQAKHGLASKLPRGVQISRDSPTDIGITRKDVPISRGEALALTRSLHLSIVAWGLKMPMDVFKRDLQHFIVGSGRFHLGYVFRGTDFIPLFRASGPEDTGARTFPMSSAK